MGSNRDILYTTWFWRGSHVTDAFMHQHRPWWVHSALIRARSVLPTHLSANLVSPAGPNELRTRKTFGVCRIRMPSCVSIDGPFPSGPHFARTRAKRKRSFRTDRQRLASFRAFGAIGVDNLRCLNWSARYPNWSLIEATWTLRTTCPHARW